MIVNPKPDSHGETIMSKLEIFGFNGSTYVRTALMACEEKGVDHVLLPLEFGAASHRALHPFLKMPAMRHGDINLFETAAITTYVDAIGRGPALQPKDPEKRALMWQWVSSAIDYLYDPLVRSALSEDGAPAAAARQARQQALDAIEGGLAGSRFFAGDTVSLADLFVAPMIAFDLGRDGEGEAAAFNRRSGLAAWYDRLAARDSFKRTAG
jgi:glutathione S-transferase